jgi:iron complex transport system substrate-binding protein
MRIVSLACSNTEILHALGVSDQLVGVDSHSDFPRSVLKDLPRVGPDLEIDVASVVALEPDLVLASLTVPGHETVVEGMEAAGVPLLTLAPESLDDVPRSVERVAERVGREVEGRALADRLRRELIEAGAGAGEGSHRPSILIQWWPKPIIAPGARSWIHGLLAAAGATHPLAEEAVLSRPLDDEEVAAADPDAIVLAWCGVEPAKYRPDVVMRNPVLREIRAVRNGRVHLIPEAWLGRPGPRLLEGLRALRTVVRNVRDDPPSDVAPGGYSGSDDNPSVEAPSDDVLSGHTLSNDTSSNEGRAP